MNSRFKGYLAERKIRKAFEAAGWTTIRSGGSYGAADIVALKNKTCILIQVKATRRRSLRVEGLPLEIQGFPVYLVVDYGYNRVKVYRPGDHVSRSRGIPLDVFIRQLEAGGFNDG
jgi:hypothetical protein